MYDFSEDVAIVTGGTKGIGGETTKILAEHGATVVAFYHSDHDAAAEIESELADSDGTVDTWQVDVRDREAVDDAFEAVEEEYGTPTKLVNSAGIMRNTFLIRMDEDDWDDVIDTNLKGMYHCMKAAAKPMMLGDGGSIVNIGSVAGLSGWSGQVNYAASKGGVMAATRSAAEELGSRDVRINAVAPGLIDTQLKEGVSDVEKYIDQTTFGRLGEPREAAEVIVFVLSDRASYMHGSVVRVDGGMLA